MVQFKLLFIILLYSLTLSEVSSYVQSSGKHGENIHWDSTAPRPLIYVDRSNSQGLDEDELRAIIDEGINEWNNAPSRAKISHIYSSVGSGTSSTNSLFFSRDSSHFAGSAVLAVTTVAYKEDTGAIINADIIINDNSFFTTSRSGGRYIGDVITHEIGHFLGLGHSQVHGATMAYKLTSGQHTLSDDDLAGLYSKYPETALARGTISGKVIGGSDLIGILGAHVEAYSVEDGKILGATVSDENGDFNILGLILDKTYLLYISPLEALDSLPVYYSTSRKDFCTAAGGDYIGAFYHECSSSRKGFPKGTFLSSSSKAVAVGNISIRCDAAASNDYLTNKGGGTVTLDIVDKINNSVGDSIVGVFTTGQAKFNDQDKDRDQLTIDLTDYVVTSSNQYLEIRITSQKLYSPIKLKIEVNPGGYIYPMFGDYEVIDYIGNIDIVGRVQLSTNPSANLFTIDIIPELLDNVVDEYGNIESYGFLSRVGKTKDFFFPAEDSFIHKEMAYLATFTVVSSDNGVLTKVNEKIYNNKRDNSFCAEGEGTYSVKSGSRILVEGDDGDSNRTRDGSIACATIDISSGGGGGNPPFKPLAIIILGFCLSFPLISGLINRYDNN